MFSRILNGINHTQGGPKIGTILRTP